LNRFGFKASANFPVTSFVDTCGHLFPIISEKERFFRNCTKSGKANAEIFSELAWNNFRIWQYFPNKGGSFRRTFPNEKKNIFVKKQRILMNFHIFSAYNSEISSEFQETIRNCPNTTHIYMRGEDEREHIHIYQVIHHQSARDTLSRC
jgi:hypothetical protein